MSRIEFSTLQTHELSTVKPGWYLVEVIENNDGFDGMWGNVLVAIDPARRLRSTSKLLKEYLHPDKD